jgi:hypothetical protein
MVKKVTKVYASLAQMIPENKVDAGLRLLVALALFGWNWLEGAVFENEYPGAFVRFYKVPLWRVVLLVLLITGAMWCPTVGFMLAYAMFFYVMDMEVTIDKWHGGA